MADVVRTLESVLAEADVLVRLRLKEIGLEVPHLVVAVTPDGEVVLRSNVSPEAKTAAGLRGGYSRMTTFSSEECTLSVPLYSMSPSLRNLFMK